MTELLYMNRFEHRWLLEEKHRGTKTPYFYFDCARIARGEPLDYVIGSTPFLGCTVGLEYRPLIPRPETEHWAERLTAKMHQRTGPLRVLDLFAGSGCVGLAVLKRVPTATVTFGELDSAALVQIKKNIARNNLSLARTRIVKTDVFSNIRGRYDYIAANPPYISPSRSTYLQRSVARWEPRPALFARDNGLFFIKKFLDEAPRYLRPGGTLVVEFDTWQKPALEHFLREQRPVLDMHFQYDQYGRWRTLWGT